MRHPGVVAALLLAWVGDLPASALADARLLPTHAEAQRERAATIARDLEATLTMLAGVERAKVQITLPTTPAFATELGEPPTAAVLLRGSGSVDRDAVARLVAGVVPALSKEAVTVVLVPPAKAHVPTPELVSVGPFRVEASSATWLRATLAGMLGLQALLALLLLRRGPGRHSKDEAS